MRIFVLTATYELRVSRKSHLRDHPNCGSRYKLLKRNQKSETNFAYKILKFNRAEQIQGYWHFPWLNHSFYIIICTVRISVLSLFNVWISGFVSKKKHSEFTTLHCCDVAKGVPSVYCTQTKVSRIKQHSVFTIHSPYNYTRQL
jgi:hypothetical protein